MFLFDLPLGLDRFTFEMPDMITLHQASVHFPIGLLLTSVFCEVVGAIWKKASGFRTTGFWTLMLGTISAAISTLLGWFGNPWRFKHNAMAQSIEVHKWWGVAALAIFVVLSLWRLARPQKRGRFEAAIYAVLMLAGVVVISLTGYMGGHAGE